MTSDLTLPQLLRKNAATLGAKPAMREKNRGIWQPYSWQRYWEETRDFSLGLAAAGFKAGDKLAVIGENRPRLYFAQLAAMCLGGVAVPAYQDAIAAELAYVLDHAEVSVIVAEDQEQVDKALSVRDRLSHLKLIVYDDPRGLADYDEPLLKPFEAVAEAGGKFGVEHPGYVDAIVDAGKPDDLCSVFVHLRHNLTPERGDAVACQSTECGGGAGKIRRRASRGRFSRLFADGVDRQFAVLDRTAYLGRVHLRLS